MTNTTGTAIDQGLHLGQQIDHARRRLHRQPIPTHWHTDTDHHTTDHRTIGDLITAITRFDSHADQIVRTLATTPVGDTTATLTLTAGLLGTAARGGDI